jgi:hypothetical protein
MKTQLSSKHVKLTSLYRQRLNLDETTPEIPENRNERVAERQAQIKRQRAQEAKAMASQYEQETQPAPPPPRIERRPANIERKDVSRIIDKLKSLGGLFSRR